MMSLLYLVELKGFNRDVIRFAMDQARVDRFLIRGSVPCSTELPRKGRDCRSRIPR